MDNYKTIIQFFIEAFNFYMIVLHASDISTIISAKNVLRKIDNNDERAIFRARIVVLLCVLSLVM
jgi:hypothetical protein